jgi:hypothetical protein
MILGGMGAWEPYSPIIQGQRNKALNRALVTPLKLGDGPLGKRHPALYPSKVGMFVTIMMCGLQPGLTLPNRPQGY